MQKVSRVAELLANAAPILIHNLRLRLARCAVRAKEQNKIILLSDNSLQLYAARKSRIWLHRKGLSHRILRLASVYHLDQIEGLKTGTLIDCGANIGELGGWAQAHGMADIAFEPEHLEADCCDQDNFGGKALTRRKALWKETTTLEFFHTANTADSSAFSVRDYSSKTLVPAARLDDEVDSSKLSHPIILKLEAEGAEPEVLEGAATFLTFADYVTVDCGYERGANQDHTFIAVNDKLSSIGYRISAVEFKGRLALLFHREENKINISGR